MQESRRGFLKALAVGSAAAAATTVAAVAKTPQANASNGVVVGHSPKKEITYKKTKAWEEYYRSAR